MINQLKASKVDYENNSPKKGTQGLKKGFTEPEQIFVILKKNVDDAFDSHTYSLDSYDVKLYHKEVEVSSQ